MSDFTCINCSVRFANAEIQRDHYKTDWHRYNLKRKVAVLPPVTAEEFARRVIQQRTAEENAREEEQSTLYCNVCRKPFNSKNGFDNHLNSKKHKDQLELSENPDMVNVVVKRIEKDDDDVEVVCFNFFYCNV